MRCKCFSSSDLRSFLILFFCSMRKIWLLNLLHKELSIFLWSRCSLMNSGIWTWSLRQDATLSWWHLILKWCAAMISAARRWAWFSASPNLSLPCEMLTKEWAELVDLGNLLSASSCKAWVWSMIKRTNYCSLRWCNTSQSSNEKPIKNWSLVLLKAKRNSQKRSNLLWLIIHPSISLNSRRSIERSFFAAKKPNLNFNI